MAKKWRFTTPCFSKPNFFKHIQQVWAKLWTVYFYCAMVTILMSVPDKPHQTQFFMQDTFNTSQLFWVKVNKARLRQINTSLKYIARCHLLLVCSQRCDIIRDVALRQCHWSKLQRWLLFRIRTTSRLTGAFLCYQTYDLPFVESMKLPEFYHALSVGTSLCVHNIWFPSIKMNMVWLELIFKKTFYVVLLPKVFMQKYSPTRNWLSPWCLWSKFCS